MKLAFTKGAQEQITKHSEQGFPNEICGFLYGTEQGDTRWILNAQAVENSKEGDQTRRFEIAPVEYIKAEKYAIANGLTLLGIYHSHPKHPAIASEHDLKQAVPFFSYVITSVFENGVVDFKSWQLNDDGAFDEEEVSLPTSISPSIPVQKGEAEKFASLSVS